MEQICAEEDAMNQDSQIGEKNFLKNLTRRDFVKYFLAGAALSVTALEKLNAGVYQSIHSLNQK